MIKTILATVVAGAFLISAPAFANEDKAPAADKAAKGDKKDKKKDDAKKEEKAGGGW